MKGHHRSSINRALLVSGFYPAAFLCLLGGECVFVISIVAGNMLIIAIALLSVCRGRGGILFECWDSALPQLATTTTLRMTRTGPDTKRQLSNEACSALLVTIGTGVTAIYNRIPLLWSHVAETVDIGVTAFS